MSVPFYSIVCVCLESLSILKRSYYCLNKYKRSRSSVVCYIQIHTFLVDPADTQSKNSNGFEALKEISFILNVESLKGKRKMGILGFQKLQTEECVGGTNNINIVEKLSEWKT